MAGLLLLRSWLGFFFPGRTGFSSVHHILPFLLPSPFQVCSFSFDRLRRLVKRLVRSRKRRLDGRRNLRLCRSPRCTFPGLVLYQLHKTSLGFPLHTHFVEIVLGVHGLIENLELIRRVYQIDHFVRISFLFFLSSVLFFSKDGLGCGCPY